MDNETEYVRRLQEVDDRSRRNEGHVKQDLAEIKEDVKGLAARPGKRWDSIVSTLLAALVGAFAAWLISGGM